MAELRRLELAILKHMCRDLCEAGENRTLAKGSAPLACTAAHIDVTSWSQFLLKYVVSPPAVTCAIRGSSQLEHLEHNYMAGRGRIADPAMRKGMEAYWDGKA
jgi:aryl-alcohol dehydrogenase-like predicted oxidoreductase